MADSFTERYLKTRAKYNGRPIYAKKEDDEEEQQEESRESGSSQRLKGANDFTQKYLDTRAENRMRPLYETRKVDWGEPDTSAAERFLKIKDYLDTARNAVQKTTANSRYVPDTSDMESRLEELRRRNNEITPFVAAAERTGNSALAKYTTEFTENNAAIRQLESDIAAAKAGEKVSRVDELKLQLEEAKRAEELAKTKSARYSGMPRATQIDAESAKAAIAETNAATQARKALEEELARIEYINEHSGKTYEDDFFGQFGANMEQGRLSQDVGAAYNAYLNSGDEEDRAYADALAMLTEQFQVENKTVLDDEGAVLPWITKSAAGYLPQLWDQTKAQLAGGAVGALGGLAVGHPLTGAKIGATAATGLQSYGQMRGAAYQELINAGVDEETARKAASDEAVISSLIEMADTGVDMLTFGTGKILKALGKGGVKAVAGEAAEGAAKKLLKALGKYALDIGQEMVEEGAQQAVSIANRNRAQNGDTGLWNLTTNTIQTAKGAVTGENEAARAEIWEAAREGGKIAAMMGGAKRLGDLTAEASLRSAAKAVERGEVAKLGAAYQTHATNTLRNGLTFKEGTEAHTVAQEVMKVMERDGEVSDYDLGRVVRAQAKTTLEQLQQEAQKRGASAAEAAQETAEPVQAAQEQVQTGTDTAKTTAPLTAAQTRGKPVSTAAFTGYGEAGVKAFDEAVEKSGQTREEVRARFQSAYEAGLTDVPLDKVADHLADDVQTEAYFAGRRDYAASLGKAATTSTAGGKAGFDATGAPSNVKKWEIDIVDRMARELGVHASMTDDGGYNGKITGSEVKISRSFQTKVGERNVGIVYHAVHEMGMHRVMALAPGEGRAFVNAMYQHLGKDRPGTAATLAEEKRAEYGAQGVQLSTGAAMEELAANEILKLYGDDPQAYAAALTKIAQGKDEQAKRGLARIGEVLGEIIEKIRRAVGKLTGREKAEAQQSLSELEQLRELYENALKAAVEQARKIEGDAETKNTARTDGVQYETQMSFKEQVDAALDGTLDINTAVYVMDTPEMLQSFGLKDYPMLMTQKHIRDINHPKSAKNSHWHGISEETIKQLPELIENPVMVLRSATKGTDVVIVTDRLDPDGLPVIVSIHPDGKAQYNRAEVASNFITSMYGRGSFASFVRSAISEERILYNNTKRTRSLFSKLRLQLPDFLNRDGFFKDSVAHEQGIVKGETQFSLKDSEGRELDEDKKRTRKWFQVCGNLNVPLEGTQFGLIRSIAYEDESVKTEARYSLKDSGELERENARLREVNQSLREQFRVTEFAKVDAKSLDAFTKKLLKDYSSRADREAVREALDGLYTYMANGENGQAPAWEDLQQRAYKVAQEVLSSAVEKDTELWDDYKDLRDYLRTTAISLDKAYEHDLGQYESLEEFRRANFGRIKLASDGLPIDRVYQELSAKYPGFFDEEVTANPADQLLRIEEVLNSLRPVERNPYSHDMRNHATWLASDILDRLFELPQAKPTYADKAARKLAEVKHAEREKVQEKNERVRELIAEKRKAVREAEVRGREMRDEKAREITQRYRDKEAKASESRKEAALRDRITRHVAKLDGELRRPTDKKHIPDDLRTAVATLLETINLESGSTFDLKEGKWKRDVYDRQTGQWKERGDILRKRSLAFAQLREVYQKIIDEGHESVVVDPALVNMLDYVSKLHDVKLANMTYSELVTVWTALQTVEYSVRKAGKTLSENKYERTVEWANALVADTATRRAILSDAKKDRAHKDIEVPYTFFSRYGEAGHAIYRMLRNAQDHEEIMQDEIVNAVGKIASLEQQQKLEQHTQEFKTERDETLTLSKAHVMEIYLLHKREQGLQHLMRGGIVQPEVGKVKRGTEPTLLSLQDVQNIVKTLTPEEKAMADAFQKLTLRLAEWGNEASMKAYGYKKFTDPNYWTIRSADEQLNYSIEKNRDNARAIANMGSAQALNPLAGNAVDIGGIFQTFDRHASDMLKYSAWLCPMEDVNRLFNFKFKDENDNLTGKTVQTLLNKVGGASSTSYWKELMKDIQAGIKLPDDTAAEAKVRKIIGNVKKASVAGNVRVVAQQHTAYAKAMMVLDPDVMIAAVTKNAGVKPMLDGWKKAVKYAPIAARKASGGFEIAANPMQLGELMYKPQSKLGKAKNWLGEVPMALAGKMDEWTWGTIWNACETQTLRDKKSIEKGSEDYYEAVADLFTEVIDQTQVVDGVLQRSQAMRSGSTFVGQMTAFTGEPTQTANIVIRAYDKVRWETDKKKRGAAIKNLGRAVATYVLSSVYNAFIQSLWDAVRDDEEDEDYWDKVWKHFSGISGDEKRWYDYVRNVLLAGNVVNNLNPATWIPVWKDIFSVVQGYSVERMDAASFGDFLDSVSAAVKSINGDGKYTAGYAGAKAIVAGSKLLGSSASNVLRDVEATIHSFQLATDDLKALYDTEKLLTKPQNNKKRYMDLLFRAYESDAEAYEYMHADLLASGFKADALEKEMDSRREKAALTGTGYKSSKAAYDALYEMQKEKRMTEYNELRRKMLDASYTNADGKSEKLFTQANIDNAMHSRKVDEGVDAMGFSSTDGVYDAMYDELLDNDMGDYYKYVMDMMGLEVEPSSIESAMRSRAKADGLSVDDLTEALAAGGFKPKFPVASADTFDIDDLTAGQYKTYSREYGDMVDKLIDDFVRNGFNGLEPADANTWLSSAYNYAKETALETATNGKYESDTKWINEAQAAAQAGVPVAEYIITKDGYGTSVAEKLAGAAAQGITTTQYQTFRDNLNKFDEPNGNGKLGTWTQEEVANAVSAIPDLTDEQRAYLWQDYNKSWKESSNPFR